MSNRTWKAVLLLVVGSSALFLLAIACVCSAGGNTKISDGTGEHNTGGSNVDAATEQPEVGPGMANDQQVNAQLAALVNAQVTAAIQTHLKGIEYHSELPWKSILFICISQALSYLLVWYVIREVTKVNSQLVRAVAAQQS